MAKHDGDPPLTDAADALDDRARGLVSNLTEFNVKKPRPSRFSLLWLVLLVVALGALLLIINRPAWVTNRGETPAASSAGATVTDQDTPSSDSDPAVEGPISGTWIMYWTNSKGSEKPAFTITFTGTDSGTVEILGDATVSDATFKVEGDTVSFEFTRTFEVPIGDWPENSYFDGTLTGADEMSGKWGRQDWNCWPEPDAGCGYEVEWLRHASRLVREP